MTDKAQPGVQPGEEHREVVQPDSGQQGAQVDTTGDAQRPAPAPNSPAGTKPGDEEQTSGSK